MSLGLYCNRLVFHSSLFETDCVMSNPQCAVVVYEL